MDPVVIGLAVLAVVVILVVAWFALRPKPRTPTTRVPVSDQEQTATEQAAPAGLRSRLSRSRSAFASSLQSVFSSSTLSDETWTDLEDALIAADVGPTTAESVVAAVRKAKPETPEEARNELIAQLESILDRDDRALSVSSQPSVVIVVGVNGTGKTTSIAKIAKYLTDDGQSVVLGAADTFRAAADTQLKTWGDRVGVPVVRGSQGADPASVAYEAYQQAVASSADVVIVDTAGRLHSQSNLMDELSKIVRVLTREGGEIDEVLLVLDGTVGQNGLTQAHAFTEAVGVTGVVLTKLDGTARGGVVIAIEQDLDVPVKMIGVGEGMDDLIPFEPAAFVDALVAP
ncbi:MAG: signal recognition particle-docking protein FtsY [Acidimicrobiia bacterium]